MDVAFMEGGPTMIGSRLDRLQHAPRALQPSVRDRERTVNVEVIGSQPGRHARGARSIAACAVEAIRACSRVEGRIGVVEPPRRPAQAFNRLRRFVILQVVRESRSCCCPPPSSQSSPARGGLHADRCLRLALFCAFRETARDGAANQSSGRLSEPPPPASRLPRRAAKPRSTTVSRLRKPSVANGATAP
jgi:hypothetical protein